MIPPTHNLLADPELRAQLTEIWERSGDAQIGRLAEGHVPGDDIAVPTAQERDDWVSTLLMNMFRDTGDPRAFALLFELNRQSFMTAVQGRLRRSAMHVDPNDVVQEVFLNIYRYPHKFHADRADAFRNWGHRIAQNTLLKFLRTASRCANHLPIDDELSPPTDTHTRAPDQAASESERAATVNCAYLLFLNLYLLHFQRLSAKEQRALVMVEVEGISYKDAAATLGLRLENLKMVIFRGRRKIFRGMQQSLLRLSGCNAAA